MPRFLVAQGQVCPDILQARLGLKPGESAAYGVIGVNAEIRLHIVIVGVRPRYTEREREHLYRWQGIRRGERKHPPVVRIGDVRRR